MKKILLHTFLLLLPATFLFAQDTSWQPVLKQQLSILDKAAPASWPPHVDTLVALSKAHPEEWLLQYYAGWAYTQLSFKATKEEAEKLSDQAAPFVKKALEMQPAHTETLALMGYWLSARINAVPSRGASLGSESRSYAQKAIDADSANPRAFLVKALNVYYTPAIFGGGKKRAQPLVAVTGEKFASFTPANELLPSWGRQIFEVLRASYR